MRRFSFVKRDTEVVTPPVSLQQKQDANRPSIPPTYSYIQRREPHVGATFLAVPDDQYFHEFDNIPSVLGVSAYQEAPDPLRQSKFWADGKKVKPWAHHPFVSKLNIAYITAISDQTFRVGRLPVDRNVPMYQGTQLPSVQRYNIQEGQSATFGSQYEVSGVPAPPSTLVLANGMSYTQSLDGHPY